MKEPWLRGRLKKIDSHPFIKALEKHDRQIALYGKFQQIVTILSQKMQLGNPRASSIA
jgi:hypothetical protein